MNHFAQANVIGKFTNTRVKIWLSYLKMMLINQYDVIMYEIIKYKVVLIDQTQISLLYNLIELCYLIIPKGYVENNFREILLLFIENSWDLIFYNDSIVLFLR